MRSFGADEPPPGRLAALLELNLDAGGRETLDGVSVQRGAELMTLIAGDGAPLDGDAVEGLAPAGVEVELEEGGQPSWWWLVSAE